MLTVALLGAALVVFAVAGLTTRSARATRSAGDAFLRGACLAQARVVDMRERSRARSSDQLPTYFPVVAFDLPDGGVVESEVLFGARPAPARLGDTVEVRYDPDDPRRVALARGMATAGSASAFTLGLAVVLWTLGGVVVLLWVLLKVVLRVPA